MPEVAHILSFYSRGSKLSLFLLYQQRFPRYGLIFKMAIFGHDTWPSAIVLCPTGSKLSLFSLYGQRFSRYGPIFKIGPYLGMKLGHWPKFRSCIYTFFLPQGGEIELIFALRAVVPEIRADFQNCHIWAWILAISHSSRSCTYTLYLPQRVKIWAYFCSTGSSFWDKGRFSKLPYLGMKIVICQFSRSCTYTLFLP